MCRWERVELVSGHGSPPPLVPPHSGLPRWDETGRIRTWGWLKLLFPIPQT
ncbi:hypothetical protein GW17_00049553, partial [Ensete ventricosum]